MSIVTRFPPSPTGMMHIGNARTALFNWIYARGQDGQFVLRIEDTDKKRSSQEAVDVIFESLKWLGLDWDNADDVVYQTERADRHVEVAHQLLAQGKAYKCYCSPEELEQMRETARAEKRSTVYDRRWRDRSQSDAPHNIAPVIRIKSPLKGEIAVDDAVQGCVSVDAKQLDDYIIVRSDGSPTYMLSVVVDDHDMGITHILRGDDHLNNAFRQRVLYDAMGWDVPIMGHMPLITGADGAKYSKRHGAVGVLDFRAMGILPEALRNYMLRLGWGHGDDEIISDDQAFKWFDIKDINKSPSKFDVAKLEHLNAHYINNCDDERLLDLVRPFYDDTGCTANDTGMTRTRASLPELKSRATTLVQLAEESAFYHKSVPLVIDDKAQALINDGRDILQVLYDAFKALDPFTADTVKSLCKDIAKTHADGKMGKIGMPLRAALTGRTVSPSIFDAAAVLGQNEVLARLKAVL